ncbi:MAG: hypothetical protein EZS28_002770 [Streblomastix strix]|uniref:Uncharacterized protein n=1 Tax=Streblomastix strix TaxID=222440 RepID=A0A5J4X373_9EUKA|nr:MAG: hypothetical protein EZS28_002770 [Streblomastix strix]
MDIDAPVDFKENSETGAFFPTEYLPPGFFTSKHKSALYSLNSQPAFSIRMPLSKFKQLSNSIFPNSTSGQTHETFDEDEEPIETEEKQLQPRRILRATDLGKLRGISVNKKLKTKHFKHLHNTSHGAKGSKFFQRTSHVSSSKNQQFARAVAPMTDAPRLNTYSKSPHQTHKTIKPH